MDSGGALEAVIVTAALDETGKSAWCREHGVYPDELLKWRTSATTALAEPEEAQSQPASHPARQETHQGTRTRVVTQGPGTRRNRSPAGALKKSRGDLQQGRGRMIGLEDRQALARDIHVAHAAGARLKPACAMAGIELRTLQRWQATDGLVSGDRRPQAVRPPAGTP
jgi:putative transposase